MDPGSAFLATLANSLQVLANDPRAAADFRTAGFYELPHPTLPVKEIVVLNTVLWSRFYSILGSDGSDPGAAEIQWLTWKLYEAKTLTHKIILVMHIPPGIDAYTSWRRGDCEPPIQFWQDRYSIQFLRSEEHTSELQSHSDLVCRLLLETKRQHLWTLDTQREYMQSASCLDHVYELTAPGAQGPLSSFARWTRTNSALGVSDQSQFVAFT